MKKEINKELNPGCFEKENPKLIYYLLYFLLEKISDRDDFLKYFTYFNPTTLAKSDVIGFKDACINLL